MCVVYGGRAMISSFLRYLIQTPKSGQKYMEKQCGGFSQRTGKGV